MRRSLGDLLMLRISASGDTLTGATNDATCDDAPVSLTVPLQTASFYPTSDAHIKPTISVLGGCGNPGIWTCLDEAEPDGDGSAAILFTGSALRVGFTVPSDAVSGAITDVRFQVGVKAQSGTVEADRYSFAVYSGSDVAATISGAAAVGPGQRRKLEPESDAARREKAKASVRAKVEHPFLRLKRVFGYAKVRYRGLAKNTERLALLFGLGNLLTAEGQLRG